MRYSVEEVIRYVREVFGEGYIEGAFISSDAVVGDIGPEDDEIITSFSPLGFLSCYEGEDFAVYMGMTKLVIYPYNTDYVIKIPFTGAYEWDENTNAYDENGECAWDDLRENFHQGYRINGSNVCDLEMRYYDYASEDLLKVLLPNEFVTKLDNIDIYVQEKYKYSYDNCCGYHESDYLKSVSKVKKSIITKITKETWDIGAVFIGKLIENYGIATAKRIVKELRDIDDLHPGNYGFAKNGRCVVFDYAGFSGDYYS